MTTSFGHDPAGRLLSTQADSRSTSYAYDGLDRRTGMADRTQYGTNTTTTRRFDLMSNQPYSR